MPRFAQPLKIEDDVPVGPVKAYMLDESRLTARKARLWSEERLAVALHRLAMGHAAKGLLAAEIKRREAWRSPAGWAFYASCVSVVLSATALAVALLAR